MIRKAEIKDVRKIAEFMKQFEQATAFVKVDVDHTTKVYEDFLTDGSTTLLILEEDGVMQGGLGFIVYPDLHSGVLSAIETYWFVAPEYRGGWG